MLHRGASRLACSKRGCHGVHNWAALKKGKDRFEEGPRGLPADMPKFPHGIHDTEREKRERPYCNFSDEEAWGKKFRKWLETAKSPRDAGGDLIETKPYHCFEEWAAFKEKLAVMSDEEKKLLGHSTNQERVGAMHEVFQKSFDEMEECAVHLRADPRRLTLAKESWGSTCEVPYSSKRKTVIPMPEATIEAAKGAPIDYMQELRDAIAAKKAAVEGEEGEESAKIEN
eukprot:TRINITY_DN3369_c0_g1_i3.p1 TRINITY_DN3369_c0_g1~~TRINITY_DN3369_c0_g1_i3.p1  ORF type:complete len:228 (+),score=49.93 TRINITY_DN3369_c0_g1_i3:51-734(+)